MVFYVLVLNECFVMKTFLSRLLLLVSCFVVPFSSVSQQLSAPNRVSARAAAYSPHDSLFFFSDMGSAQLKAVASPGSQFRWLKYNEASSAYDLEMALSSGAESLFMPAVEGGYRVEIQSAGATSHFNCWCFAPVVESVAINQTEATCYLLSLESSVKADTMVYYNPANGIKIKEGQKLFYRWTANPEIPLPNANEPHLHDMDAPTANITFQLSVTNEAGQVVETSFNHEALAVAADFNYEVVDREWDHELGDEEELSAPAILRFENLSKGNITAYEWVFEWTLETQTTTSRVYEAAPVYTFQQPGNYEMLLTVTNERSGCSSESSAKSLKVLESSIEFPNVFTPNGDGVNDEFRPAFQSIKNYNIVIYNRWGRKVYESSDLAVGWDGKIGNGEAAPGVYFYVCEAEGYVKGERHRKKGSVTIIR